MAVDFDFQRYVARRKGASAAQVREGAAYAYPGDLRVLHSIERLRPVQLALGATVHMWQGAARAELLGSAVHVSAVQFPVLQQLAERAAAALHIAVPTLYVAPALQPQAHTFGVQDDAYIVLDRALISQLNEPELLHVIGHECGHIQNNHAALTTALYYLRHFSHRFLKWVVKPAVIALESWSRRAAITCDRAGLLATRDLDLSQSALIKMGLGSEQRLQALRLFADSAYYRGVLNQEGGLDQATCDAQVAELMRQ